MVMIDGDGNDGWLMVMMDGMIMMDGNGNDGW